MLDDRTGGRHRGGAGGGQGRQGAGRAGSRAFAGGTRAAGCFGTGGGRRVTNQRPASSPVGG
jgi:hypothetical protein